MAPPVEIDRALSEPPTDEEAVQNRAARQPVLPLRTAIDRATHSELLEALVLISHRIAVTEPRENCRADDDVFLSTRQLAARIPYTEGTINTYVSDGRLVEGVHYKKKGNRTVWSWKAVKAWVWPARKEVEQQQHRLEPISQHTRRRTN